ncbi:hypothetical protein JN531_012530 [Flagellatimonas centrodinii]|uniref:hypothetical protein n=1 Tax=Flagellatimonas centrodinii TaxID=2806210 RepID=UPI001FEF848C|nr:hypothetical protein [Flagellatimonas centrodinii]ULQ45925.1 hypothetical protein JN531_012530 [Flagellatimonas centrodinii]
MRVNVYAEEMTDRIQIISKEIDGQTFTGLRIFLELPATVGGKQYQGPFMHHPGDDDSAAVTFWGKQDLRAVLRKALAALDDHYADRDGRTRAVPPLTAEDVKAIFASELKRHVRAPAPLHLGPGHTPPARTPHP